MSSTFAVNNAGISLTTVARASTVAEAAISRAKDENSNKSLDLFELKNALAGESAELQSVAIAAFHSATNAASGQPIKKFALTSLLYKTVEALAQTDADTDAQLSETELDTITSGTQQALVVLGNALPTVAIKKMSNDELADAVATLMQGVSITSESDSAVTFALSKKKNIPLTSDDLIAAFPDEVAAAFEGADPTTDLVAEIASTSKSKQYFKDYAESDDEDPTSSYAVSAAQFAELRKLFGKNLTDVRYVKIGPKETDGSLATDQGQYLVMFVGKTADDKLAAATWTVVET